MKSNHHLKTMLGNLKGGRSHAGLSRRSDCHDMLMFFPLKFSVTVIVNVDNVVALINMQFVDWVGDCKKKRRLDHRLGGNCDVDSKKYRFRKKNASAIGLIPQNHRKILLTLVRTRT
ncbi:unnamed protein product [Lactuca virosa]|uniref:Uncharacterized protein n=1 Tax=Lactuca virosa TaxID=75947 RepID=A0AAU9MDP2_9ASTR|nr:unnamed protein product [Lactuca virosa]